MLSSIEEDNYDRVFDKDTPQLKCEIDVIDTNIAYVCECAVLSFKSIDGYNAT